MRGAVKRKKGCFQKELLTPVLPLTLTKISSLSTKQKEVRMDTTLMEWARIIIPLAGIAIAVFGLYMKFNNQLIRIEEQMKVYGEKINVCEKNHLTLSERLSKEQTDINTKLIHCERDILDCKKIGCHERILKLEFAVLSLEDSAFTKRGRLIADEDKPIAKVIDSRYCIKLKPRGGE
jgi:hypothetical protein